MQFTRDDVFYHRERNALQMLIGLGVNGDILFQCATRYGATPDAFELVERGQVAPETVIQRGREGPPEARGIWLGLAARAALVRGDRFRTVRLLKEAVETASPEFFLAAGPTADQRVWAAMLVLRTIETRGGCSHRNHQRLTGVACARAATRSLLTATDVLSPPERGLLLRAVLVVPWTRVLGNTGLSVRMPEIIGVLRKGAGAPACLAAAQSVIERGDDAVRRYPLDGLLPEVRRPGDGLVFEFDAQQRPQLGIPAGRIEIDRLTAAVQGFSGRAWEADLRPLVARWLAAQAPGKADRALRKLTRALRADTKDEGARAQLLGLLDWMVEHPEHAGACEALDRAMEASHAAVRKAGADLALAMGRDHVLATLADRDPNGSVRRRAEKLLASGRRKGTSGSRGDLVE